MSGRVRVGRSRYVGGKIQLPEYAGFTRIVVMTERMGKYGQLSPYSLKNSQGQILENVWQFSKVYANVPEVSIPYSSKQSKIVWAYPAETHLNEDGTLREEYWRWRMSGKNNPEPVRNPVGWKWLNKCLFALKWDQPISNANPALDYIESRKQIYLPNYLQAVMQHPLFNELLTRRKNGENLLIVEIDGPHAESLKYYSDNYGVTETFIQQNSVEVTQENMNILLNDSKHPFGHGYCLGMALMGA